MADKVREVTIGTPDDWHLHVRDGDALRSVVPLTARQFGRAIIMPNLPRPVATTGMAAAYKQRILDALPSDTHFQPLMTLYMQTTTSLDTIRQAKKSPFVKAIKLYPQGATTNSEGGVKNVRDIAEQLRCMEEVDLPLLIHGETAEKTDDVFDREAIFFEDAFQWLVNKFPKLRIVFEHITTKDAVAAVSLAKNCRIAATITAHHLLKSRNDMLSDGICPHLYCKPILKREQDRFALLEAATSGDPRFFLGTDSAPHPKGVKENACGCAGVFTAHAALELYAEAFDGVGKIDRLNAFAHEFGADFYQEPRNRGKVTLIRDEWDVPEAYEFGGDVVTPYGAGQKLSWKFAE